MIKLQNKKDIYSKSKQGQGIVKEYRNIAWACKNADGKVKAQLELKLASNVRDNKKSFCDYTDSKRTSKENVDPLLKEVSSLVAVNTR